MIKKLLSLLGRPFKTPRMNFMHPVPCTIDMAVNRIIEIVKGSEDRDIIKKDCMTFVGLTHAQLGRWIRNEWGFWTQNTTLYLEVSQLTRLSHPDDLSGILMELAWYRYHGINVKIDQLAVKYHQHWINLEVSRPH